MCIFHLWEKWADMESGDISFRDNGEVRIKGSFIRQKRRCANCGKVQLRMERTSV